MAEKPDKLERGESRAPLPAGEIRSLPEFKNGERPIGLYKGQIEIGPEFFEPLPDDELALWEGGGNDMAATPIERVLNPKSSPDIASKLLP
jgi:hypothetical protein